MPMRVYGNTLHLLALKARNKIQLFLKKIKMDLYFW